MKRIIYMIIAVCMIFASVMLVGCTGRSVSQNKERIGIIGAMDNEVSSLKEAAKVTKTTKIAEMEFCEGTLGGKEVVIVKCGMGKVNAGICAQTLISHFGCSRIINTGVAGSLDGKIAIGDMVVSVDVVQHDFNVEYLGFKKGEIPYTEHFAFEADKDLRSVAVDAAKNVAPEIHVFEGRVCSGDQFISTKEQRNTIISNFGGLCCEMEGGAIAQVCYLYKIPFVIIRAISDNPSETEFVEYTVFEAAAAARCSKIVQYMVEQL